MVKATFTMPSGVGVTLDGAEEEVAALVRRLHSIDQGRGSPPFPAAPRSRGKARPTPMTLITGMISEGFFAMPKELGSVRDTLKERGHHYPVTTLSPAMLRLVRKRELRRIKDKGRWTYVGS